MSDLSVEPAVANCPPSAKLVYLVLDECGPMTQQELRNRTKLSTSTARSALTQLQAQSLAKSQPSQDGRSDIWSVANK